MTKYLMILAALFALVACGGEEEKHTTPEEIKYTEDGWAIYAGLEWSPLSENEMKWQAAMDYCESIEARLPNITELRKIIINCPGSTYGGACQVSDPDCLSSDCRKDEDCLCDYSAESYSALGDGKGVILWSSSSLANYTSGAWYVIFDYGDLYGGNKNLYTHARCVR